MSCARSIARWSTGAWNQTAGMRNSEIIPAALSRHVTRASTYVDQAKEVRYRELIELQGIELLSGVAEWIQRFQTAGWKQAVASSAPPENVATIAHVLHFNGTFEAMISGADVQRGKPDPDIFLAAAQRLNVEPQHCLVIEDAAGRHRSRAPGGHESHRRVEHPSAVGSRPRRSSRCKI